MAKAPPEVEAEIAQRWSLDAETAKIIAQERIDEWDYDADPHGYCHERTVLIALLDRIKELEAQRG